MIVIVVLAALVAFVAGVGCTLAVHADNTSAAVWALLAGVLAVCWMVSSLALRTALRHVETLQPYAWADFHALHARVGRMGKRLGRVWAQHEESEARLVKELEGIHGVLRTATDGMTEVRDRVRRANNGPVTQEGNVQGERGGPR